MSSWATTSSPHAANCRRETEGEGAKGLVGEKGRQGGAGQQHCWNQGCCGCNKAGGRIAEHRQREVHQAEAPVASQPSS